MIGCVEIACAIVIVTICLYYYLTGTYDVWKELGVAGPKPLPVFGNVKAVVLGKTALADCMKELYDQYETNGMFGIFLMKEPHLVLTDPELIRDVLIKDFANFADRGISFYEKVDLLSPNLFNLEPKRWRPLRTRLSPVFTAGKMKDMFAMISECSEHLEKMVAKVAETEESVEIYGMISRFAIDVIGTCAFGIEANALADDDSEFRRICKILVDPSGTSILKTKLEHFFPSIIKLLLPFLKDKYVDSFFSTITLETMKHRREKKIYRNDFINTLLELQDQPEKLGDLQLTDELTAAQAFIFFAAGFESSSTAMTNALYELALNQDIQSKLREEVKETLSKNSNMDYGTVKSMQYLNAVLKETLRKYPALPNLRRKAENSYTFQGTKITIPAGQRIIIPVHAIQRDSSIYPNADVFDPDRFRDGSEATRHPMHYLPFGDGSRNCIGARFATHLMKVGLIKIIRNYKIDVCKKTPIPYVIHPQAFMITSREPIHLRISKCGDS